MDNYRVEPDVTINLNEWDPDDTGGQDKDSAEQELKELTSQLEDLQTLLYAEHKRKMLIVLQAMDTGGKDGTIRHVFSGVNPQGVRVASFKVPTQTERDHDFLWRVHAQMPGNGEMVIFNRSHYEDVLVVRVHDLVPQKVWQERYEEIRHFEEMLANEGTTILKFYLNIDRQEQKKRLQARLDDPKKHWKFNSEDLVERKLWDAYMKAYQDAISKTSTYQAPWYIIPANHKWYRDLVVSRIIVKSLQDLGMEYPKPTVDVSKIVIE